jgi:hypothetical protein
MDLAIYPWAEEGRMTPRISLLRDDGSREEPSRFAQVYAACGDIQAVN